MRRGHEPAHLPRRLQRGRLQRRPEPRDGVVVGTGSVGELRLMAWRADGTHIDIAVFKARSRRYRSVLYAWTGSTSNWREAPTTRSFHSRAGPRTAIRRYATRPGIPESGATSAVDDSSHIERHGN